MHRSKQSVRVLFLLILAALACRGSNLSAWVEVPTPTPLPTVVQTEAPEPSPAAPLPTQPSLPPTTTILLPSETAPPAGVRFAVIGDYGQGGQNEADVAELVKSWNVDFILTLGDNNYPSGWADTIDQNIGQFYSDFIFPYKGKYGAGADLLRFFPVLGNHDLDTARAQAYYDYFELPGNERYYEFIQGPVHFFALNTDSREVDGVGRSSVQAEWLRDRLAASNSIWNIVYGHHPPYTSGLRGPVDWMRWPFKDWGATAYMSGHDHFYERLDVEGLPYFINGIGGGAIYDIGPPTSGSMVRFNEDYGAMLVEATDAAINFQFITRSGEVVDELIILKNAP